MHTTPKRPAGRARKTLLTLAILGAVGSVGGFATFSAFSGTTANAGNSFTAGSVSLADNDAGVALYNLTNQKPLDIKASCIKVTYSGSLDASVKLYASTVAAGGQYVDLKVTKGTGTSAACTDFAPAATTPNVFTGTVGGFATTYPNYASGLSLTPATGTAWITNSAVTYKFEVNVQDNDAAQGATTGTHSYTWEARNN